MQALKIIPNIKIAITPEQSRLGLIHDKGPACKVSKAKEDIKTEFR